MLLYHQKITVNDRSGNFFSFLDLRQSKAKYLSVILAKEKDKVIGGQFHPPTFYAQLLCEQMPKARKNTVKHSVFLCFRDLHV